MVMNIKQMILSIAEYVTYFVIFYYVRLPIHEWCHLSILRMLGGDGYIRATLWGAETVFTRMPTHPTIVAFSGGLGLGTIFLFLMWTDWIDGDYEEVSALLPNCLSEYSYGVFEGLLIPGIGLFGGKLTMAEFLKYGTWIGVAGWTFGLILGWHIWLNTASWLNDNSDGNVGNN